MCLTQGPLKERGKRWAGKARTRKLATLEHDIPTKGGEKGRGFTEKRVNNPGLKRVN